MTINDSIAVFNTLIAVGLMALGIGLFWQARGRWFRWPVGARVALGGAFLSVGLCWGQLVLFRQVDLPHQFEPNGLGTFGVRLTCMLVVLALARRVFTGTLLTDADRQDGAG